ncbi:pyridoxal phosphate-dependent aminotransferase [Phaeodactylibacter xiamenensis]|uniref:pyridoxal phosphate-dependent aminotransferase n=1 Tax=Phaeodactylibacter xiamenensis TaxID=1524460 RepID=UPI003CCC0907
MTKSVAKSDMIIQPASRLGEVKEYYFSTKLREIAQMRAEGKPVLNLGIGSPDLPPSHEVIDTLTDAVLHNDVHGYQSYMGIPELRAAFAEWYEKWFGASLDPEGEILPLMGSKEGLMHIAMAFLESGDEVLVPNPGYPAYRAVSNLTGATIREYKLEPERGWLPDMEALESTDLSRVKIMWLNYPNMPTGTAADLSFLESIVAFAHRHRILIVNDNPYSFILNEQQHSILSIPGAKDVAVELNSLSKGHNMAGWRIGMLAGRADYLKVVLRFKSNMDSGMFKPVQLAAAQALKSPLSWYKRLNGVYAERRETVFQLFDALDCKYDPKQVGMFVWAKIPDQYADAYELADEVLYQHNVFITPGGIFGSQGDRYLRISLCSDGALYEEAMRRVGNAKM